MQFPLPFPFYFGGPPNTDADGCWVGLPTSFELKLLQPLPTYALEQLRLRFLHVLSTNHEYTKSARILFQMAFETEMQAILVKMIDLPASVAESKVCQRRHFIDVDKDMQLQRFMIGPALDELGEIPGLPAPYMDFLRRYVDADYARYRVCALCVAFCLAAFLTFP